MTVHTVRTLKTIRKESMTNRTCYFALCSMSQNSTYFNGFAKLSSDTIAAYAYYCGPESRVNPYLHSTVMGPLSKGVW